MLADEQKFTDEQRLAGEQGLAELLVVQGEDKDR